MSNHCKCPLFHRQQVSKKWITPQEKELSSYPSPLREDVVTATSIQKKSNVINYLFMAGTATLCWLVRGYNSAQQCTSFLAFYEEPVLSNTTPTSFRIHSSNLFLSTKPLCVSVEEGTHIQLSVFNSEHMLLSRTLL